MGAGDSCAASADKHGSLPHVAGTSSVGNAHSSTSPDSDGVVPRWTVAVWAESAGSLVSAMGISESDSTGVSPGDGRRSSGCVGSINMGPDGAAASAADCSVGKPVVSTSCAGRSTGKSGRADSSVARSCGNGPLSAMAGRGVASDARVAVGAALGGVRARGRFVAQRMLPAARTARTTISAGGIIRKIRSIVLP